MKRWLWLTAVLGTAAALAQPVSSVSREGAFWVQTVTGSVTAAPVLQVRSEVGGVMVSGEQRQDITYVLKRRARAANEQSARRLLDRIVVKNVGGAGTVVLEVTLPNQERTSADLQVRVPRGVREATVSTGAGGVRVVGLAGSVRADTGGGGIEVGEIGGPVLARTGGGGVVVRQIGGKLDVYSGGGGIQADGLQGEAHLNTGGGQIAVRGVKGPVEARSMGGSIRIERAESGVRIASSGGLIDVVDTRGPVVAETAAGSIKVKASSNVRCDSGAGTIHLQAVSGELKATTRVGGILADLAGVKGLRNSSLTTSMGDITVFIPSNLAVTIQAMASGNGGHRVVSDFPQVQMRSEQGRSGAQGNLNGGGPVLRLETNGGTIYLRHEK